MINSLQRYFCKPDQQLLSIRNYLYRERLKTMVCLLGIILPFTLFCFVADKIEHGGLLALERAFLWSLRVQAQSLFSDFAEWMSMLVTVLSVCMLCYLLYRQLWRTALFWLLAIAGAATLGNVMKGLIQRARPELWLDTAATSFGFPSGHATHSMAIVIALLVLLRLSSWHTTALLIGLVFAALVGLSRMYLGYHYPSDILAGWMLALFWVMTLRILFKHSYLTLDHKHRLG
ncbi:phosphatidylglycerophosphatase B-related protein [Janthinobacterium sp. Marseille]|nr:phosphatase PAP2 family protein [Janthinobacterium sp. Marseille]ABR90578.1 phosphatidylglycerophosphatase B-related protein [Janthinobacterium sp. Marseille]